MTYRRIIVTICAKYFQNPSNYEEVTDWTQNIPYNRLRNLWPLNVTLEVGTHVLRLTYRLIIVIICAIFFKNLLMYEEVMDGAQNIL
jgi:hypothetical protein